MNKIKNILIILLLFVVKNLNATPELDTYSFRGIHIELDVIYRYENPVERLYYKSMIENLDNFIDSLKHIGKLNRGKIYLSIQTAIWMDGDTGIEMYRWEKGYYCWLNARIQSITQDYMTKIIAYFASDNWESFCYDNTKIKPDKALQIFNKRIDTIDVSHQYADREVLKINDLSVCFQNGYLICKNANKEYGKIDYFLPFSSGLRNFIAIGETIYVVENGSIINQIQLTQGEFSFESWGDVFPKWVNFRNNSGCFLSYSMEKNKFYKLNI